jgi:hypothetical protein
MELRLWSQDLQKIRELVWLLWYSIEAYFCPGLFLVKEFTPAYVRSSLLEEEFHFDFLSISNCLFRL